MASLVSGFQQMLASTGLALTEVGNMQGDRRLMSASGTSPVHAHLSVFDVSTLQAGRALLQS